MLQPLRPQSESYLCRHRVAATSSTLVYGVKPDIITAGEIKTLRIMKCDFILKIIFISVIIVS
jgi:hypothetical protein